MRVFLLIIGFLALVGSSVQQTWSGDLTVRARPGPWPVADRLIAYRGRLWFSASVKGVNHNSADIWSLDPQSGELRFERYLFSQDSGIPTVHRGLLYWPHEDMRMGTGTGVISVTNGERWRNLYMPVEATMMHTHAVTSWQDKLVAVLAGWNGVLATSDDAGRSWNILADDPPREGAFHRYNGVTALGDRLFIRHWEGSGVTLAEFRDGRVADVDGWPVGSEISEFAEHNKYLYAIVVRKSGRSELWRITQDGAEQVVILPSGMDMRALASDGKRLWLAVRTHTGGQLWSSSDGDSFSPASRFDGGEPVSITALAPGSIYVGGRGADGNAIIWGPPAGEGDAAEPPPKPALPAARSCPRRSGPRDDLHQSMVDALADIENYSGHGRGLREIISSLLERALPQRFFSDLLDADIPGEAVDVFGGQFTVPAYEIGIWQLINAMEANCEVPVPLRFLGAPWKRASNGPEKWFDPLLVSMRVIQQMGQNDRPTVDALIMRLDQTGDPDWLRSQVTGTLTAITRQRFAYDITAWQQWWSKARQTWPEAASGG